MKFNPNNLNHQMIIAGLAGIVEEDGLSPHEAFGVLEDIKRNTFHALQEIKQENKGANKHV